MARVRGLGQERVGQRPEAMLAGGVALIPRQRAREAPTEDPRDVRVQDRRRLLVREGHDRARRVAAHPRQLHQPLHRARELPGAVLHDLVRDLLDVATPALVAERVRDRLDLVQARGRYVLDAGEATQELVVDGRHAWDLRLLQHDLRDQMR